MKRFCSCIWLSFLLFSSCIEEIAIDTDVVQELNIENVLVIEATLTDELKNQIVYLSRGSNFANDSVSSFERNAMVNIVDNLGNTFNFSETEPGSYFSDLPFRAEQNRSYQLGITTQNGERFESEIAELVGESKIDSLYADRVISANGVEGLAIFIDSSNPLGNTNQYRYIYEETYKIIAPNWNPFEFEIIREEFEFVGDQILYPDVRLVPRAQEEQVCFNTVNSTDVILSNSEFLSTKTSSRNLVRFINSEDPIISHRYSVLVKQFVLSDAAFGFYTLLNEFSQNALLFSETQPGQITGNISSLDDSSTYVIGFFDVTSVTEQRLYFNYVDFYPNEDLPPYFGTVNCDRLISPPLSNPERDGPPALNCPQPLIPQLKLGIVKYFEVNGGPQQCEGPYFVTQRACSDCTVLGSNIVPEFWTEE